MIQKMFKFVEMKMIAWYNISYVIVNFAYIKNIGSKHYV